MSALELLSVAKEVVECAANVVIAIIYGVTGNYTQAGIYVGFAALCAIDILIELGIPGKVKTEGPKGKVNVDIDIKGEGKSGLLDLDLQFFASDGSSKSYKKYTSKQIEKKFNLEKDQFHREIKADILADLSDEYSPFKNLYEKMGKNPDIYLSADNQIQIVSTQYKGKSFITDLFLDDFLP